MNPSSATVPSEATIELDGRPLPLSPGLTLADLLVQQGIPPGAVATALNQRFVPRTARAGTALQPGDRITTFEAITGG